MSPLQTPSGASGSRRRLPGHLPKGTAPQDSALEGCSPESPLRFAAQHMDRVHLRATYSNPMPSHCM